MRKKPDPGAFINDPDGMTIKGTEGIEPAESDGRHKPVYESRNVLALLFVLVTFLFWVPLALFLLK